VEGCVASTLIGLVVAAGGLPLIFGEVDRVIEPWRAFLYALVRFHVGEWACGHTQNRKVKSVGSGGIGMLIPPLPFLGAFDGG